MLVTLRSGLGREISTYRSYVVPRVEEFVQVAAPGPMLFQVKQVRYQVENEEGSSVDVEVVPVDDAARKRIQELFTLYEEYGRSYGDLGLTDKALEYLDRAQANLPKTKFWELLIATSRAMALIRGSDMEAGVKIAVEVTQEIKSFGVLRYLDRIILANKYLENLERKIGNVRKPLADALYEDKVTDY